MPLLCCVVIAPLPPQPEGRPPLPWPSVHAPWYGYLFWTLMSAGSYGKDADTNFVAANVDRWDNCTANIKVRQRGRGSVVSHGWRCGWW